MSFLRATTEVLTKAKFKSKNETVHHHLFKNWLEALASWVIEQIINAFRMISGTA